MPEVVPGAINIRVTKQTKKKQVKDTDDKEVEQVTLNEPVPSTSHSNTNHNAIMAALNNIQEAQKKQRDEVKSLSERIDHIENYEYDNEYENYDDDYQEQDEGEKNEGITEPPPKKNKDKILITTLVGFHLWLKDVKFRKCVIVR